MTTELLVKIILAVALALMAGLTAFVVKNDFARETLEPTYTALGAILVSSFLLVKLVLVDSPESLKMKEGINVIQNLSTGQLHSLFRPTVDDAMIGMAPLNGITNVEKLPYYTKFKELNLSDLQYKLSSANTLEMRELLLEEAEFVLIQWLAQYQVPAWLNDRNFSQGLNSGGGTSASRVPAGAEKVVMCDHANFPQNRFLTREPQRLVLPTGAIVSSEVTPGSRVISIESKYSSAKIVLRVTGGGQYDPTLNQLNRKIAIALGLDVNSKYFEHRIQVEWGVNIKKFTRFSSEAKLHKEWSESTQTGIREAFSTGKLIQRYL